jgi:hypothetical protein
LVGKNNPGVADLSSVRLLEERRNGRLCILISHSSKRKGSGWQIVDPRPLKRMNARVQIYEVEAASSVWILGFEFVKLSIGGCEQLNASACSSVIWRLAWKEWTY